mgnify:CR=1 FL=1
MPIVNAAVQQEKPAAPRKETPEVTRGVIAAKKILALPDVSKHIVQMMQSAPNPATGIAQAVIFVMQQLYAKSNGTLPPQAMVPVAQQVLVDVMKIGVAAGLFKYTPDLVKQATTLALQMAKEAVKQQPAPEAMPAAPAAEAMPAPPAMGA